MLGIGELPEAISARGAMPCGEESAVAGDRRIAGGNLRKGGLCRAERREALRGIGGLPEAISARGAMPPFNKIVAIFLGVFIVR